MIHLSVPEPADDHKLLRQFVSAETVDRLSDYVRRNGLALTPWKRRAVIDFLREYKPKG